MNRKFAILSVSILIILGSSSATLLSSYSIISGDANIDGPVFYAGPNETLYLNEVSEQEEVYKISDNEETTIARIDKEGLASAEWYDFDLDIHAEAKIEDQEGSGELNLKISYYDEDGEPVSLCNDTVKVTKEDEFEQVSSSCEGSPKEDDSITGFRYTFEPEDGSDLAIKADEYTRFEVNAQ